VREVADALLRQGKADESKNLDRDRPKREKPAGGGEGRSGSRATRIFSTDLLLSP
jgi:hypothetical protein